MICNQGTLFSLAGYATITNFKRTSKFADLLPAASDLFFHPIDFFRTCIEVLRLHTAHVSAETAERRKRKVEDVQKRSEYRKKHGLETEGVGGWTAKTDVDVLGPAIQTGKLDGAAMLPILESEGMARGIIDTETGTRLFRRTESARSCLSRFRARLLYIQSQRGYSVASVSGPR